MKTKIFFFIILLFTINSYAAAESKTKVSAGYAAELTTTKRSTKGGSSTSSQNLYHGPHLKVEMDKFYLGYKQTKGKSTYKDAGILFNSTTGQDVANGTIENDNTNTTIYAGMFLKPEISLYVAIIDRKIKQDRKDVYNISTGNPVTLTTPSRTNTYKGKGFGIKGNIPSSQKLEYFYDLRIANLDNADSDQAYKETAFQGGVNLLNPGSKLEYSVFAKYKKRDYEWFDIANTITSIGGEVRYKF